MELENILREGIPDPERQFGYIAIKHTVRCLKKKKTASICYHVIEYLACLTQAELVAISLVPHGYYT